MLGEGKTHSVNWLSVLISVSLLSLSEASIIVHDPEVNSTLKIRDVAPSDFGPDIPDDGIFGYLVHSKPTNACAPIEPPPDVNISSEFVWIALIARSKPLSSCSFAQKVINAQTAGFSTVIVYNRPGNEDVITMHADPREAALVNIPSVFIGNTDGLELKRNFIWSVSGDRYYLEVTPGYSPFDLSFYLLPFAIVVGICFVLMVIFMLAKWIRDYRKRRKSRLSKSNLKKLPVKKFKKGDNYDMCAICLDEYDEGDKLRILPCSHAYHMKCVDPWLTNNKRTCPVCKRRVLPNDPERSSESEDSDDDGPSETSPLLPPPAGNRSPRRSTFENSGLPITSRSEQQIVSSSGSTEGPDSPQRMQHHNSAYDTDSSDEEPQSVHARDQSATKPAQDITTPQAHGDSFEFHPNYFELKTDNDMAPLLSTGGAGGAQENTLCVSGEVHSNDGLISIEAPDVGATVEVHTSSGVPNEAEKV